MVVIGRAFYIQRFEGKYWQSMGDSLHQKFMPMVADRGSIYSEDGNILSTSVPIFDIYVDFAADVDFAVFGLHYLLDSLGASTEMEVDEEQRAQI